MELEEFFPLDQLPVLVIEEIASYLSNTDLAACCAVSRGVREAFDIDTVWKPRYDEERVKYLLQTPCKVYPTFEIPEFPESGLRSLSENRKAFMAENHLWNNWRQGNYNKELVWTLPANCQPILEERHVYNTFLTNDFVMSIFENRIEILDVRDNPPSHAFKSILQFLIPVPFSLFFTVLKRNDKILVLYKKGAQVYFLCSSSNQWTLKHSFFYEDLDVLPDDTIMMEDRDFSSIHGASASVDNYLVWVKPYRCRFHIWNFETGVKIKEEICPIEDGVVQKILVSTSKDLIFCVEQEACHDSSFLLAYSLSSQSFLSFKEILEGSYLEPYDLCMFGNYIAVWDESKLNIYDYLQSQIILRDQPIEDLPPQAFGNGIVFLEGQLLKLFNPSTLKMYTLQYEYGIANFQVIGSRFIQIQNHYLDSLDEKYEILEISSPFNGTKKATHELMFEFGGCECMLNEHSSRLIEDLHILHFW